MGEAAYVYGWGTTEYWGSSPSELLEVEVRVVSQEECRSQGVTAAMLCAGGEEGKDSCQVSDIWWFVWPATVFNFIIFRETVEAP